MKHLPGNMTCEQAVDAGATPLETVRALPFKKVVEVEDFVDFLRQRDETRRLVSAAVGLSERAFHRAWDKPDDASYDRL